MHTVEAVHEYIFDLTLNLWNSLPDCEYDAEAGLVSGSESDLEMSGFNSPNPGLPLSLHDRPIVTTDDEQALQLELQWNKMTKMRERIMRCVVGERQEEEEEEW